MKHGHACAACDGYLIAILNAANFGIMRVDVQTIFRMPSHIVGTAGLRAEATNLPDGDPASWHEYVQRVEQAARDASLNDASLNDEGPTGEPGGAFVTTYGWR